MTTTANTAAPHSPSLYNEQLFYAVLRQGNPSESRVEALAALALRHLAKAAETWAALRKVLMEQSDFDAAPNRTLWYVMDALLKAAPHVFVPLLAPRLLEYSIQQLPWELAGDHGQTRLWFESLVLSWEAVLPQRLYAAIRQHAVQSRSGAELHGLLDAVQSSVDDGAPATTTELQRLQDSFDTVRYLGEEEANRAALHAFPLAQLTAVLPTVSHTGSSGSTTTTGTAANVAATANTASTAAAASSSEEDEDEYAPDFVVGAQRRELPKLDLPKQKRRRDARRRPREDDLGM